MKTNQPIIAMLMTMALFVLAVPTAEGQILKKLGKRAQKAAERTVERRVEEESAKKTDEVLDSILEPGQGGQQAPAPPAPNPPGNETPQGNGPASSTLPGTSQIQVYSKFDFVPGDKLLFYDDFANDFIGDFPAKWNTNGSGEVVTLNDGSEKWFSIVPGYNTFYVPDVPSLPENYTIEFDLLATGLDRKTASTAILRVVLTDDELFKWGNYVRADIPFCQYHPVGFRMRNHRGDINNNITADIRQAVLEQPHISIAVNNERFRLWVNEKKYVDIPRVIPQDSPPTTLKFELLNFTDGKERLFMKNLKVAEGGVDLRRKLIAEGKVSTNGILFDSGSANLQPQSMGIIRQISQVLLQEKSMRMNIIGHTDADGDEASNLSLSTRRAEAVKQALVEYYNIAADRLETEGKGESEPVGDNATVDGKAQNRRVEFVKM